MSFELSLLILEILVLDLCVLQLLGHGDRSLVQQQELGTVAPVAQSRAVAGSQTQVVLEEKKSGFGTRLW